jgi:alpha-N-arabinofuranosidase
MPIPEFILQKLIVPGSLKETDSGFEFVLLNTFASATINNFQVMVANNEISPSSMTIIPSNSDPYSGKSISTEQPLYAPVGEQITIKISNYSLDGNVQISADTREIGHIEFSLADSKKMKSKKEIRPSFYSFFQKPLQASIEVNLDQPRGEASPFLLGQFVEHLERCVYDGIWTNDGKVLREDTLELLKNLKIPMIRYPGGNFASGYHWEDGIGPKNERPGRTDKAWLAEESNQVGTDEFLSFCEEMDIEPYLVVNDGSGTPEEGARWVAYCNSPEASEQGQRRSKNGHPQPYNVKYWGIGNEVWGQWQIGTTSAKEYVKRMKEFAHAMKAVDPSIKLICVGNNPLSDDPTDPRNLWNDEVLKSSEDFDFLSWHIYQPEQESWKESYDPKDLFGSVCAAPIDFENIINRVHSQIQNSNGKNKITQCIDEWNLWLPPLPGAKSMHQVTYTLRDSLYVAGIINTLYRNFDKVDIANLAQLVNVLPLIKTNDSSAIATSIYYPFVLAAELEEMVLPVKVDSPTYDSFEIGANVQAHNNVPVVDAIATQSQEKDECSILVINRSAEKRTKLSISMEGASSGYSQMSIKEIRASSPEASNTFEHPEQVKIHSKSPKKFSGKINSINLPPSSVVLIKLFDPNREA